MSAEPGATGQRRPRLEVRLLGQVGVVCDGQRLRAFDALRLQRFLALITLRGDLQHRARLAFELWPDSSERQARTNLRKLIHDLRNALPDIADFIELDHEIVRWMERGPSTVDVSSFRQAIAVGDPDSAARIYSGDLLPALYDDWVLTERAKLRAQARAVFAELAERATNAGDHGAAVEHVRRILDLDPTDESGTRLQMEAYLALGEKAEALRAYHRLADVLERELSVAPGEATRDLARRIRGAGGHVEEKDVELSALADSPFVGREAELAQVRQAWESAKAGGPSLVLLSGEPGIGKSRLAAELGRHVRSEGHDVATARAYEAAGRLPWGPVVDLLRSDAIYPHIASLEPAWRAELGRLIPELLGAAAPEEGRSGTLGQRHRLFDAVRRALSAGSRPRLLIVDDLQWCDVETIELLGFVARSGSSDPLMVVGTVRPEEVDERHALTRLVEALTHDRTVATVPLQRLDEETTASLAGHLHDGEEIDGALAARLWQETEGNPLFVIEAIRAGFSSEVKQVLTPTMRTVLGARLGQLSDGALRLTELAAVIGRSFTMELIVSASDIGQSEAIAILDDLWRRRIVRDQGHTYDFSHDKLRAVALERISPARRRQLHRSVAEALQTEFQDEPTAAGPRLAAHYDQAGMVRPAIEAYRTAGSRAVEVSALDEAVALFSRALTLLAELPASSERDALELDVRIALGSPLVAVEGYGSEDAHRLYERAHSLCRKVGRPVDPPILRGLGLARLQGCHFDDSSLQGQALLDHEGADPVTETEGRYLLGVSAFWRGELVLARDYLAGALEGYDASRRDEHLTLYAQDPWAVCTVRRAWVELWQGDPVSADRTARAAVAGTRELDHLMTLAYVITYAAVVAAESDDLERLAELLADAEQLWKRLSERYLVVVLDALRGWLAVHHGSAEGIEMIVESVARSRARGETLHLTYCLLLLARARGSLGEIPEGRAAAREGLSYTDRWNQRYLEAELWRVDGELAFRGGEADAAQRSLRAAVGVATDQGADWLALRASCSLVSHFPADRDRAFLAALVERMSQAGNHPAFRAARRLSSREG